MNRPTGLLVHNIHRLNPLRLAHWQVATNYKINNHTKLRQFKTSQSQII